ncbi:MAG TPA: prepilin peptidase, partial [Tepidisphaeraceae bacterium]|nr:prepilin peptidase [Tepidisphaeraceae bacterium]
MPHWLFIPFIFALGACVGSFLNVVAYRLPLGKSIVHPPSACPKCNTQLSWRDNIPIFGWLFLGGKCRYCRAPVSIRYPTIELITALLFAGTYVLMFVFNVGPCPDGRIFASINDLGIETHSAAALDLYFDWPALVLALAMIGFLMAASLIDFDHFIIPLEITWILVGVGLVGHALTDQPHVAGNLLLTQVQAPLGMAAITCTIGWLIALLALKRGWLKRSFMQGEPMLDREIAARDGDTSVATPASTVPVHEYSKREVRREMLLEAAFLALPILFALVTIVVCFNVHQVDLASVMLATEPYLRGFVGSLLGAVVGALTVWLTRVFGSLAFGKEAMGMGDVHLMAGIGAILGPGPVVVTFFLAA